MDITTDSIGEIVSNCKKFVAERENWEHEEYGKNRDEVLMRKYNTETMKNIPNTNIYLRKTDFKADSFDDELVDNLKFIQFRFQSRDTTIIFVRKFTRQKILSHGKKLWREISGTLTLTDDSIVEIPTDYDFCKYGHDVAIFHPDNFEDFFDYHEIHEKHHKTVFTHFQSKIDYKIIDLDKYMGQTFEHPQKLRKLPSIVEKKMYLMTYKQIQHLLKVRPMSTVKLDVKKRTIEFKDVFAMMDFYNDAHLNSPATKMKYLAQYKSIEK